MPHRLPAVALALLLAAPAAWADKLVLVLVAGGGGGPDGGPAARAKLVAPFGVGVVTTVAGNGEKGVPKDGEPAVAQPLVDPRAAAADADGNVYVLERGGHALRVVDKAGRIRTVAGTGAKGSAGVGGPALMAQMN